MAPQRHSLVTGGAGFIGRALVSALVERGDRVTVVEPGGTPFRDDVAYRVADVRDAEAFGPLVRDVDVVFHNASIVHTKRNREQDVWDVNLGGSRVVLDACRAAGVKRLIYVSSASAVYEGRDIENGTEALPYSRISQAPYADSKIAAEREILAANGRDGLATCAIRPHVVFGPGDTRFLPAILERARNGKLRFSVGLRNDKLSDFTYVTNVVDALLAADERLSLDSPVAGQPYFITNGEPMPFFDFVNWILRDLDMPTIRYAVPYPVAYAAASVAEALDSLRGGTLNTENGLSRFAVRYMCTHHYFSIDKARRELGYEPRVDLREGVKRSVEYLRERVAA
ncbi:MAG: NAD-dependent epimerase/dehydratase family protein [Myxococcota bacterium]